MEIVTSSHIKIKNLEKNIKMSQINDIVNKQLILYYYMQSIEILLFPS